MTQEPTASRTLLRSVGELCNQVSATPVTVANLTKGSFTPVAR